MLQYTKLCKGGAFMNTKIKNSCYLIIKELSLSAIVGLICGIIGALFSKSISLVTNIRNANSWLIYFLPLAGILTVALYKLSRVSGMGTNQVIKSANGKNAISPLLAPAVFIGSALSHLCGASVGREGAALQLGGSISTFIASLFHLEEKQKQILIYCGMAGLFSAVFGTPFAAFIFALEVVYVGHIRLKAVLPTLLSSFTAYFIAILLGSHPERFAIAELPQLSFSVLWKVVLISLLGAGISMLLCFSLKYCERLFKKLFNNEFVRITIGGALIVILTLILKTTDYNGAGIDVIERIFNEGTVNYEAFLLKLIFTSIAVAAGYKGGEIIPTLFIGATFGASSALLLGMHPALGAAVGMTALFCGVTNCPLAAILLSIEMFSGKGWLYFIITAIISFLISGRASLYSAQKVEGFKDLF